jgi:hypothetical protein
VAHNLLLEVPLSHCVCCTIKEIGHGKSRSTTEPSSIARAALGETTLAGMGHRKLAANRSRFCEA